MATWMLYVISFAFIAVAMVCILEFKRWKIKRECTGKYRIRIKPPNKSEYERMCDPIGGEEGLKVKVKTKDGKQEFEYTVGNVYYTQWGGWLGQPIATIDYFEGIPDPIVSLKTRSMPLTSTKMETRLRNSETLDMLRKWQEENGVESGKKNMTIWFVVLAILTVVAVGLSIYLVAKIGGLESDIESIRRALGIVSDTTSSGQ